VALISTLLYDPPKWNRDEPKPVKKEGFELEKKLVGQFQSKSLSVEMFKNDTDEGHVSNDNLTPEATNASMVSCAAAGTRKSNTASLPESDCEICKDEITTDFDKVNVAPGRMLI
jgi:hypothetical protein